MYHSRHARYNDQYMELEQHPPPHPEHRHHHAGQRSRGQRSVGSSAVGSGVAVARPKREDSRGQEGEHTLNAVLHETFARGILEGGVHNHASKILP